jgi:hypothetical protein
MTPEKLTKLEDLPTFVPARLTLEESRWVHHLTITTYPSHEHLPLEERLGIRNSIYD